MGAPFNSAMSLPRVGDQRRVKRLLSCCQCFQSYRDWHSPHLHQSQLLTHTHIQTNSIAAETNIPIFDAWFGGRQLLCARWGPFFHMPNQLSCQPWNPLAAVSTLGFGTTPSSPLNHTHNNGDVSILESDIFEPSAFDDALSAISRQCPNK